MGATAVSTEDAIYAAAVALMAARGYHGTSLRDVSAAVRVQTSSLYYHFPSKQALLVAIMRRTLEDLAARVQRALESGGDPRQRLAAAVRAHVLFHIERQAEALVTDSEIRALEPDNRAAILQLRDDYERLFSGLLREGVARGLFAVEDVAIATKALLAMATGVVGWYRPSGRLSAEAVAALHADLCLRMVGREERKRDGLDS